MSVGRKGTHALAEITRCVNKLTVYIYTLVCGFNSRRGCNNTRFIIVHCDAKFASGEYIIDGVGTIADYMLINRGAITFSLSALSVCS